MPLDPFAVNDQVRGGTPSACGTSPCEGEEGMLLRR